MWNVPWESFAVAGKSQGGDHAVLIGTLYLVARVTCFAAPKDCGKRL
jgi:hypothetical protein